MDNSLNDITLDDMLSFLKVARAMKEHEDRNQIKIANADEFQNILIQNIAVPPIIAVKPKKSVGRPRKTPEEKLERQREYMKKYVKNKKLQPVEEKADSPRKPGRPRKSSTGSRDSQRDSHDLQNNDIDGVIDTN
jgi:hypothetical protein